MVTIPGFGSLICVLYMEVPWEFLEVFPEFLNVKFLNIDNLFELRSNVNYFIILRSLHVIVSEFYDLDVGTVKKIYIKPKRLPFAPSFRAGWNLKEVT